MEKGKLIVIEGTDCSGKETQSNLLREKLVNDGLHVSKMQFPAYDTPTGRIIGGCYLGKDMFPESDRAWFPEGATNVDPLAASALYAADRRYNLNRINNELANNDVVILDRYVESNMAHQGGKISDEAERKEMYRKLEMMEFQVMGLPRPDQVYLLYMPYLQALELKKGRNEKPDQHEANPEHLKSAERAYLELAQIYGFDVINCVNDGTIRTIPDINQELCAKVRSLVRK